MSWAQCDVARLVPVKTPLSQPYWLREPAKIGTYRVADPTLIGRPENPPAYPIEQIFEVGGQKLVIADEPVEILATGGHRRLEVVAPVALSFDYDVQNFIPGVARPVQVHIAAVRPDIAGELRLEAPSDWKITSASQPFQIAEAGQKATVTFTVTPPAHAASTDMVAHAQLNGSTYDVGRVEIRYNHIPPLLLQPTARAKSGRHESSDSWNERGLFARCRR